MSEAPRLLVIDDDPAFLALTCRLLNLANYNATGVERAEEGLEKIKTINPDAIITDYRLRGISGLDFVREARARNCQAPIILTTGYGSDNVAIEAIKEGAFDYLQKPFSQDELLAQVRRALETKSNLKSKAATAQAQEKCNLVGHSRTLQAVFKEIGQVAAKNITVLIRGESGTGKELVARAIHEHSDRSDKAMLAVNCVAIPETLLESELFGHERGAFTGAHARRIGRFEQAAGGTIFLDEIGDMSLATQAKLLRVLQGGSFQRLGGQEEIKANVRIIAATNRDLEAAIEKKLFRQDLFYRLSVVDIHLPPLRERADDIPELVNHFIAKYSRDLGYASSRITLEALEFLQSQPWPGNVRELENIVRKAILFARDGAITLSTLTGLFNGAASRPASIPASTETTLVELSRSLLGRAVRNETKNVYHVMNEMLERELYSQAIALARGNQRKAAGWLGVSRPTMREKLVKYGLHQVDNEIMADADLVTTV